MGHSGKLLDLGGYILDPIKEVADPDLKLWV